MELTSNLPTRRPLSPWTWAVFFIAGVLLPLVCFLLAVVPFDFAGTWQSGNLNDIVCYLLTTPAAAAFYPILLYAMTCMSLALIHPPSTQRFVVRLGIYTAVLPALQYMFILTISITDHARFDAELFFVVALVGLWAWGAGVVIWISVRWLLPWLLRYLPRAARRVRGSWILIVEWFALILVTVIGLAANFQFIAELLGEALGVSILIAIFGPLAAAPYWAFAVYGVMSVRVYRQYSRIKQFTLGQALGTLTWLAAYLAAWRWGLRLALEQYAQLPTEPPGGCYVCSAAAKGHAWCVRAQTVYHTDHATYRVNDQMRYLKCAEIMLKYTAPRLHTLARAIYDRLGPFLAARMVHPLLADLAYAACKPAEWLTRVFLIVVVPRSRRVARLIYAPRD